MKQMAKLPLTGFGPQQRQLRKLFCYVLYVEKKEVSNLSSFDTNNFSYLCQKDEVHPVSSTQKFPKG